MWVHSAGDGVFVYTPPPFTAAAAQVGAGQTCVADLV
jgi:hypothetical protein